MTVKIWPPEAEKKILKAYEERKKRAEKSIRLSEMEKASLNAWLQPDPDSWYGYGGMR